MQWSLSRNCGRKISGAAFFLAYYFYLWLAVKPNLIYHGGGMITNFPVFYKGWAFFNELVRQPGGPVEYASFFLSQILFLSWAGALVLTIHAFLTCVLTGYFLKKIQITWLSLISFIPAVLLLTTYNLYAYHFTTTLALLIALAFSCLYVTIDAKNKFLNALLFLFLFAVTYLIAAGASFYFVSICAAYEIFFRRRWLAGLLSCILAAIIGYILGVWFFDVSPAQLYSKLLPFSSEIIAYPDRRRMIGAVYALYLLLPSVMTVIVIWRLLLEKTLITFIKNIKAKPKSGTAEQSSQQPITDKSPETVPAAASLHTRWLFYIELLLPFLILAGSVFIFRNQKQKSLFEVTFYLKNNNWPKVIEIGRRYQNNDYMNHAYNRALFHQGLLLSDMFRYQQRPRCLLLSAVKGIFTIEQRAEILFDLGAVNDCESELAELMEMFGERPEILKKLAVLRMAKNDINTARVYLGTLSRTLFYCRWANDYIKLLQTDTNLSTDPQVQRLRSLMPEKNRVLSNSMIEEMLLDLLGKNKTNKMAFEYLTAYYMFRLDLDSLVRNIGRLNDFDYSCIPRHYEEAILTYIYFTRKQPDLHGWPISRETIQRFSGFVKTVDLNRNNPQTAYVELAKKFGDTYQFYYAYGVSGLKNE